MFYVSRATVPYDDEAVRAILASSRRNNAREDVTGCLLFSGRFFAQVLEGRDEVSLVRLDRIMADPRHVDFRLLVDRQITQRDYASWSMGYLQTSASRTNWKNSFSAPPLHPNEWRPSWTG